MTNENKQITITVWNLDTDEIEELFMDEDDYNAMIAAEKQYEEEQEALRKRLEEEEWNGYRYSTDD